MALAISGLLGLVFGLALPSYIVREESIGTPTLRSVFTVGAVFNIVFSVLLLLSGLAALHLFDERPMGEFLLVFGFTPLLQIFELIPLGLATREMRFRIISTISVLRTAIQAGTTILLALRGYEHMSFAWAAIAAGLLSAFAYTLIFWRHTVFRPRPSGFKAIAKYGLQMTSISGLFAANHRLGELVLGSWLGLGAIGLYSRAGHLAAQMYSNVYGIAVSVFFVKMAADLREKGQFHETLFRAVRILLAVLWPLMLGVAILSAPIIRLLYGERWLGAALPLSFLMLGSFIILGLGMHRQVFNLRKQTALQTRLEAIINASGFLLFCGGALISISAAAAARTVEALIAYFLFRRRLDRLTGAPPGALTALHRECLGLCFVAVLPSLALMMWTGFDPATPLLWILAAVFLGVIGWALGLMYVKHPILQELQRLRRV
jgi:O-antigen/teichoic acid export membrane protein